MNDDVHGWYKARYEKDAHRRTKAQKKRHTHRKIRGTNAGDVEREAFVVCAAFSSWQRPKNVMNLFLDC